MLLVLPGIFPGKILYMGVDMVFYCPYEQKLECTQSEREDEFFRQMYEDMMLNRGVCFVTNGKCQVLEHECAKLRAFKLKQRKQQELQKQK